MQAAPRRLPPRRLPRRRGLLARRRTAGAFSQLSRELGEAGAAIREGRFDEVWEQVYEALVVFALKGLLPALLTLLLYWLFYRLVGGLLDRLLRRSRRVNEGVRQLLMRAFRLVLLAFAAVTVLGELGFNIAALVAGLGIAGIALGFAARDTLENFISGITILLDQPFRVGDNVVVNDTFGTVHEITLRSTRVRTLNNELAVLPNTQMIQQMVINHTMFGVLRIVVPFGIAYKERPQEARAVVLAPRRGGRPAPPGLPSRRSS